MKIINLDGDKINACFVFDRGNCQISVSTIFNENRAEIAIFFGDRVIKDKLCSISEAINYVDDFGPRN